MKRASSSFRKAFSRRGGGRHKLEKYRIVRYLLRKVKWVKSIIFLTAWKKKKFFFLIATQLGKKLSSFQGK